MSVEVGKMEICCFMAASVIFCSHCGAQNASSEQFCSACGYQLLPAATQVDASSSEYTGLLPAQTLLRERYRILRVIGQGGMGAVYLAQDVALGDRPVAIKEMIQYSGLQSQEAIKNFKHEAHLLAGLQHPNLPSIYDHFEEHGRWYLAMSYIQGETFEDYLDRIPDRRIPLDEVLSIGEELCAVLQYLHTHQPPIIFRDLKPDNIMRGTDRRIYLLDFGIARHFKPGQAKDTESYGSAGYAPPEQYGRAQTTTRSDIYSLGATLYEMVSGYDPSLSPFRFPPLQTLVPTLPESFTSLITQMLELDESKRPEDVQVVQQQLQQSSSASVPVMALAAKPKQHKRPRTTSTSIKARPPQPAAASSAPQKRVQVVQPPPISEVAVGPPEEVYGKWWSTVWMVLGLIFLLNGISGPFRFNLDATGGVFGLVSICGFSIFVGLMVILLARTQKSYFPITKHRPAEYTIVGLLGGASIVFGVVIEIIGKTTSSATNTNDVAVPLGFILIILSAITVWVSHLKIDKAYNEPTKEQQPPLQTYRQP